MVLKMLEMKETCAATSEVKVGCFDIFFSWFRRKPVVSLLRLSGVIGAKKGVTFEIYEPLIQKAFEVPGCKAVILVVNSPGGAPTQSEMIAEMIIRLSEEKKIPVYSFAEDVAASGGYWILAAGSELYASRTSVVGSIGVIARGFGFVDTIKKLGVERRVYSEGLNKNFLDPFSPEQDDDVAVLKRLMRDVHDNFKDYVMRRRINKLAMDVDDIFSGKVWTGAMALNLGLIDGIYNYNTFIAEKFGKDAKIEMIKKKSSWWERGMSLHVDLEKVMCEIKENMGKILE